MLNAVGKGVDVGAAVERSGAGREERQRHLQEVALRRWHPLRRARRLQRALQRRPSLVDRVCARQARRERDAQHDGAARQCDARTKTAQLHSTGKRERH